MTIKKYQTVKLIIVVLLSVIFSQALMYHNFFLSIGTLIMGTAIVYSMSKKVDGVISDERDWDVGGKAALQSIQIYSWIGVIVMFALKSQSANNQTYDIIATTIAFSVCILMLLYGFIFRLKSKGKFWDKGIIFSLIVLILFAIMALLGILKF
jgi:uncharacterized membrane protein